MKLKRHYFLMISCPGDVILERKLLKDCVDNINNERTDDAWVELQYWVTDTSSDASTPAQESINEQIVNECDGLIAIFNSRLGTPVHTYKCGTDEEISLMLKANKHVSLLFNTKPTIDLSNPTCIDQITKLQEYKMEQSEKAYYREFSDPESFMVLARREILMWLRSITKEKSNGSIVSNANEIHITTVKEEEKEPIGTTSSDKTVVDEDAGAIDCVIYITEAASVLTEEINNFAKSAEELNGIANVFTDKINFMKKQNSGHAGLLVVCRQFANEINENKSKESAILDNIESKWNEIYQYLLIYNKTSLSLEDETILRDSITSLKQCFINSTPQIEALIDSFNSVPNFQKELKTSLNNLSNVYKRFKAFTIKAIDNCEDIETSFNEKILLEN